MKKSKGLKPRELTLLGLLTALIFVMAFTPLGSIPIGLLSASLKMIPVAIGAVALGPVGGCILGGVFGLTSFMQGFGIGFGPSLMVITLFELNPYLTFVLTVIPRALAGLAVGYVYRLLKKPLGHVASSFISGFGAAFLNTLFFMSALVLLFSNTAYLQEKIAGQNILLWICTFVGVNAVLEMAASTLITGAVGVALGKAHLLKESAA